MKAGKLRHVISFRKQNLRINEGGTPTEEGVGFWQCRAALMEESASETIRDGAQDKTVLRFHMRFHPMVNATCQLIYLGKVFGVIRVTPMRNDREMTVEAEMIGGVE